MRAGIHDSIARARALARELRTRAAAGTITAEDAAKAGAEAADALVQTLEAIGRIDSAPPSSSVAMMPGRQNGGGVSRSAVNNEIIRVARSLRVPSLPRWDGERDRA